MDDIVGLNVGGRIFITSLHYLTRYPDSTLAAMFTSEHICGQGTNGHKTDKYGNLIIERSGELFRYVFYYLRTSILLLPDGLSECDFDLLAKEARFYNLPDLEEAVNRRKRQNGKKFDFVLPCPTQSRNTGNIAGACKSEANETFTNDETVTLTPGVDSEQQSKVRPQNVSHATALEDLSRPFELPVTTSTNLTIDGANDQAHHQNATRPRPCAIDLKSTKHKPATKPSTPPPVSGSGDVLRAIGAEPAVQLTQKAGSSGRQLENVSRKQPPNHQTLQVDPTSGRSKQNGRDDVRPKPKEDGPNDTTKYPQLQCFEYVSLE
ncbi:uncharacterized protein [Ptychodera flava]|uniref:uncharacterized protein n=1 Tax=Ptychodera flava TaxID=63121 RepID=UPI00396A8799